MKLLKKMILPSLLFFSIYTPTSALGTENATQELTLPSEQESGIEDQHLENAILHYLNKPTGSHLTKKDVATLTSLSLTHEQSKPIASLKGLEQAKNLAGLVLRDSFVTDFSPLEELSNLEYVDIAGDSITIENFPDLSNNKKLIQLSVPRAQLDNSVLSKIVQLTNLKRVRLDSNIGITTIEPLKALPNLWSLSVQFCGINDFSVINDFPRLIDLSAYGQSVGSNAPITALALNDLIYDEAQQQLFIPFTIMPDRLTNFDGFLPPFTTSTSVNNTILTINGSTVPENQLLINDQGIAITAISKTDYESLTTLSYNARFDNPYGNYAIPNGYSFYSISNGVYFHEFTITDEPVIGLPVTVKYVDEAGHELAAAQTLTGTIDTAYKTIPKELTGWTLKQMPQNAEGYFTDTAQEVVFVYERSQGAPVTVYYIDGNGQNISEPSILSGKIGTAFSTKPKEVDSWFLKEHPDNTNGYFTASSQTISFIYEKTQGAPITVEYLDEFGEKLAEPIILKGKLGEAYNAKAKIIDSCFLKSLPKNLQGVFTEQPLQITFVYARKAANNLVELEKAFSKNMPSPLIKQHETTKTSSDTLPHTTFQKNLSPGITPRHAKVQPKTNDTGSLTVKFVDEKGREIAAPTTFEGKIGEHYKLAVKKFQVQLQRQK